MQFIRFLYNKEIKYGVVEDNTVIPLSNSPFTSVEKTSARLKMEDIQLLAPCIPSKILCIGLNYKDHADECNIPLPESPVVFMKHSDCVIGPNDMIIYPDISQRVDYEAELAIVIGKKARGVSEEDAQNYIFGYTCANDVTARDLQPEKGQWTIAKGFDTFLPLGPVITDEVSPDDCWIAAKLNGKVVQASNTSNLIFKPTYLVSYLSQIMTLNPGDVIITGTPGGIGPMLPGDTIEVTISGIGTLSNKVGK